jgi:hypothetical protein
MAGAFVLIGGIGKVIVPVIFTPASIKKACLLNRKQTLLLLFSLSIFERHEHE